MARIRGYTPDAHLMGWNPLRSDSLVHSETNGVLSTLSDPIFRFAASDSVRGSGRGKSAFLWPAVIKANGGKYNYRFQTAPDCCSMAFGRLIDILRAPLAVAGRSQWIAETATEPAYAFARHEIGKDRLGNSGGAYGSWMARVAKEKGSLVRKRYGNIDLSVYSGQRANSWGAPGRGVPDELEAEAYEHICVTASLVQSWEDVCDALYHDNPVMVCSNQGFNNKRDSQGFLYPSGSWAHAMAIHGYRDDTKRPGAVLDQSWPLSWMIDYDKNKPTDMPEMPHSSFLVDAEVIDRMVRQGDSWTFSVYKGYAPTANWADIGK